MLHEIHKSYKCILPLKNWHDWISTWIKNNTNSKMYILRKKDASVRNQFQFSLRPRYNWNKIHNFFWILPTSGKIMISYVFYDGYGGIHEIGAFCHFSSKTSHQKYSVSFPGEPTLHCHYSVMSLSEETGKYC